MALGFKTLSLPDGRLRSTCYPPMSSSSSDSMNELEMPTGVAVDELIELYSGQRQRKYPVCDSRD